MAAKLTSLTSHSCYNQEFNDLMQMRWMFVCPTWSDPSNKWKLVIIERELGAININKNYSLKCYIYTYLTSIRLYQIGFFLWILLSGQGYLKRKLKTNMCICEKKNGGLKFPPFLPGQLVCNTTTS